MMKLLTTFLLTFLPQTGEQVSYTTFIIGGVFLLIALVIIFVLRALRRKRDQQDVDDNLKD